MVDDAFCWRSVQAMCENTYFNKHTRLHFYMSELSKHMKSRPTAVYAYTAKNSQTLYYQQTPGELNLCMHVCSGHMHDGSLMAASFNITA